MCYMKTQTGLSVLLPVLYMRTINQQNPIGYHETLLGTCRILLEWFQMVGHTSP
jgi:hypothetical protein